MEFREESKCKRNRGWKIVAKSVKKNIIEYIKECWRGLKRYCDEKIKG
jgi:hypothetical protein